MPGEPALRGLERLDLDLLVLILACCLQLVLLLELCDLDLEPDLVELELTLLLAQIEDLLLHLTNLLVERFIELALSAELDLRWVARHADLPGPAAPVAGLHGREMELRDLLLDQKWLRSVML